MGKFPTYQGTIEVRNVVHCSSEDAEFPGTNIVNKLLNKAWRCSRKEAGTGRASITLELDSPTYIQRIEIVNAGSAFVQVDGMISDGKIPIPLLPMRMIMSEQECKSSSVPVDYTSSHVFKRSDFADDSFRRFKFLVVTVMQPFRLGYPFGIESLVVTKPCYADKIQKQTPGLSDPNKVKEIEFSFMKQSPKKQPQDEMGWSLNDAVNDENFEMKKSAPMNRLGMKTKEPLNVPKRNNYFASLNEQHGFVYKSPRASRKTSSSTTPKSTESEVTKDEDKENKSVDKSKSFTKDKLKETTPSRKRKKSKLQIIESSDSTIGKKRNLNQKTKNVNSDEDNLPEFSLTVHSDQETDTTSPRPSTSPSRRSTSPSRPSTSPSRPSTSPSRPSTSPSRPSTSPSRPSTSKSPSRSPRFLSVSPGRCSFTKSPDLSLYQRNLTEISPGSGKNKMRTPKRANAQPSPKRANAQPSWIDSSFGAKGNAKTPSNSGKSPTSTTKNKTTPNSRRGKTLDKSPSSSKYGGKSTSTSKWNSTESALCPKFITIPDINDARSSPNRSRKLSDSLMIIDERSPGSSRTPGTSRKYSKDKNARVSVRRHHDDDVLICKPLSSTTTARNTLESLDKVKDVELVSCPICADSFLPNVIENHANNCIDSFNNLG
ncbi:muscle M-line assembly protein unc-89-like [Bolinopsis microptera]|uniref:muscle M-line assembly protein unc-89-like n=1 Tax=Bolinopsis microptera TaxID=2820187 RepID=UPI0030797B4E